MAARAFCAAATAEHSSGNRCLVPVGNFYERKKTATGKQPYAIALADARLMTEALQQQGHV